MSEKLKTCYTIIPGEVHFFQISSQLPFTEKSRLFQNFLRETLGNYCKVPPESLLFEYNDHGKPSLSPHCCPFPIQFNLSHSGDRAVLAVSHGAAVGVDIEQIRPRKHIRDIVSRFFTHEECEFVFTCGDEEELLQRFYSLWVRKEAVVKTMGESLPPWLKTISPLPMRPADTWAPVATSVLPEASLTCFDVFPGYLGALCVEGPPVSLVFK